jgi:hypothetical protein
MNVGDLVKLKRPATRDFNKVFLVTEFAEPSSKEWIKVLGHDGWQRIADFEVVNESR